MEVRAPSILPVVLAVEGAALLLASIAGHLLGVPPFGSLQVTWSAVAAASIGLVPPVLLARWSLRTATAAFVKLRARVFERLAPALQAVPAPGLLVLSLAAGIAEEALFRGVLQTALAGTIGVGPALAAVSLLFGLLHPLSALHMLLAAAMGAYLGVLMIATGNLLVPIAVHAAYDLIAISLLLRAARREREAVQLPVSPVGASG